MTQESQPSEIIKTYLTYDDVLLKPGLSKILPSEVELKTQFSRNIEMQIPLISAAMDTVTEAGTAIVMAQEGGIGVIHKNMLPKQQALEIAKVKKFEAGLIVDPITVHPDEPLSNILEIIRRYSISGLPVVEGTGDKKKLVGIITNRDLRFESNFSQKVSDVMTKESLVTAPEGTDLTTAKNILQKHRIEKLPVINKEGHLRGLITIKDIERSITFPNSNKDKMGRLRVAAAIGVGAEELRRAAFLVESNVDALVIDTAHGHSQKVLDMVKKLKSEYSEIDIVAGNVATAEACQDLIKVGVDGIKVGIGPGSICTTRVVAGIGVPQFHALLDCKKICEKNNTPFIADGGVKYSGDIVKALATGASSVMIGGLFAGADEAPGETVLYQGRTYKVYRGMGSLGAMGQGSKDRYGQADVDDVGKLVPEGIEGQVPYRGSLSSALYQLIGGLRSGMGYVGAENLIELKEKANFIRVSPAALKEGHPHDVLVTKEAPNYRLS